MSIKAAHRGICVKCGDNILPGEEIDVYPGSGLGWGHVVCPEDMIVDADDRPRCRYCGDLLTPDFECENCPGA